MGSPLHSGMESFLLTKGVKPTIVEAQLRRLRFFSPGLVAPRAGAALGQVEDMVEEVYISHPAAELRYFITATC